MIDGAALDYSGIAVKVRGLGPGSRVVLWVRGCTIGCAGCMTQDLWAKGIPRPLEPLVEELLRHLPESDGLTISGGEPFQQPEALAELLRRLRSRIDTNILCYSGYVCEHLLKSEECRELLGQLDVLMDGPYKKEETNEKQWRGSDNQRAILLSERAATLGEFEAPYEGQRELQLQRLSDGGIRIIGIPRRKEMEQLVGLMAGRGLQVKGAE